MSWTFAQAETVTEAVEIALNTLQVGLGAEAALVFHGDEQSLRPTLQGRLGLFELDPFGQEALLAKLRPCPEAILLDELPFEDLPVVAGAPLLGPDQLFLGALVAGFSGRHQISLKEFSRLAQSYVEMLATLLPSNTPQDFATLLHRVDTYRADQEPAPHWSDEAQRAGAEIPLEVTSRLLVEWF